MEATGAGPDLQLAGQLVSPGCPGSMPARRSVLLVAYHFPPLRGSSGVQRTLRFAQHLPKFGWRPIVLTIHPQAYDEKADSAGNELPADLEVHRAFGFNTAKHLSVFGRYPGFLALPDRWATWRAWAVPKGMRAIKENAIQAIWSTFPIATAQRIGLDIACRTKLPWIAEFRDPMWQLIGRLRRPRIGRGRSWKGLFSLGPTGSCALRRARLIFTPSDIPNLIVTG